MSILHDIVSATRAEIERRKAEVSLSKLQERAKAAPSPRSLISALSAGFSIIGEVKAQSPSAGVMDQGNVAKAAKVYDNSSAISAISVLTEPHFFRGSLGRLWEIRGSTNKPLLRKDFILEEYQVWEARAFGADAILLMATLHVQDPDRLRRLFDLARSLGMECLVEIGMAEKPVTPEQMARIVPGDAKIWGANSRRFHGTSLKLKSRLSRNLGRFLGRDFTTSTDRHETLRRVIPADRIAVAESGVSDPKYLYRLSQMGYDAALIGTTFLRQSVDVAHIVDVYAEAVARIRRT